MPFAYTSNGVSAYTSENILHGNAFLVSGTWTAGAATGTIVTGGSRILAAGVTNSEVVTENPKVVLNGTGGSMVITPTDTANNTGDWWAICIP